MAALGLPTDRLSHPLRRVGVMQDEVLHEVHKAVEALVAAVADLDLTAASPTECRGLGALADRLEAHARALTAQATALLADTSPTDGDRGPDGPSHPVRRVER